MVTNAEAVAGALAASGVELAFGLPGGEVAALIDACRRRGIRFLLVGHEASAAFMAEVTGQITGIPGVCIATLGPGAMNLCLGVANAFLDRQPVIALTGEVPAAKAPHFPHQRLPLTKIFQHITKESVVLDGQNTEEEVFRCHEVARTPRAGPVHIALPSDLATEPTRRGTASRRAAPSPPAPSRDPEGLDAALDLLTGAQTPLAVVGVGCTAADAPALRSFMTATGLPFVTTPKAKGLLPEDAAHFLGVVGGMALDRVLLDTLEAADVLLGIGFDPVECDKDWYVGRRVINIDRAGTAEGAYRPIEVLGDISATLSLVGERVQRRLAWPPPLLRARRQALTDAARARPAGRTGLSPLQTIRALREVLPREAILTSDVGSHKYYAGQFWETYAPNTFFMSNGLSGMGYGVPAAIAAKLHFPGRPVAAVVGDGGMLMMLHNLVFMRQHDVPVVVLVFVDGSLSLIRVAQERKGYEAHGVDFPAPDFARLARGFGIRGVRVGTLDRLQKAVDQALAESAATVIHVPVDLREYYDTV